MGTLSSLRVRGALLGIVLLVAFAATPASAAVTTPYVAFFPKEVTTPGPCPPSAPPGAFCFTGQDHSGFGASLPPGSRANEDFSGFVDLNSPRPGACPDGSTGFPDHNTVVISTSRGNLFLTTDGLACGLGAPTTTDTGTWTAHGGTGIFTGASGSGTVSTIGAPNPNGTINSASVYRGTLTLH